MDIKYHLIGNAKEYFKDVNIQGLTKTQKQFNGLICETVTFDCLSLWYEENRIIHKIEPQEKEIRWNFRWNSRFADYATRTVDYINKGHIEAPVLIEIDGNIENPKFELYVEGQLYQTIPFNIIIKKYEKFIYNSMENHFFIGKQNTDGTKSNLFNLDVINFANDNVLRLPRNKSCTIKLIADNEITNAQITIYSFYKII